MLDPLEQYTNGTPAPEPQITWTQVGEQYTGSASQKGRVQAEMERLDWQPIVPSLRLPFAQGYALKEIIKQHSGRPRRIAWNGALGPCGFYGIERVYPNGVARNYYVDDGVGVMCVRSDFWEDAR